MAENKELIISKVKAIGKILHVLLYGVYCYLELIFRAIVPPHFHPKKSLDGEIFLTTGSGTGIGREVVLRLAKDHPNTTLVLWDCKDKENQKTAAEARKYGAKVYAYHLDVTDRGKVEATAKKIKEEVGDVTILFNNAGIAEIKSLLDNTPEELEKVVQVNLVSHFWTIRAFLPKMIENNHGHIVTTASMESYSTAKNGFAYFSCNYIESLQEWLRFHPSNPDQIKFTTVFSAFVKTELTKGINLELNQKCQNEEQKAWLEADYVAEKIIEGIQQNQEKIVIPKMMELVFLFKSITPAKFWRVVNNTVFEGGYKND